MALRPGVSAPFRLPGARPAVIGEALALGSAVSFAFANVAIAKGARNGSDAGGVLLSVLVTGLLSGLGWLVAGGGAVSTAALSGAAIAWFAASGLLATVGGRLTLFRSIAFAGVVRASTVRRVMPLFSLALAWVFLGQAISPLAGGGMALITASFGLLWLDNRRKLAGARDPADISRGLALGVASALLYALSYVARSLGLQIVPDAFLGAFVGAAAALLAYLAGAAVHAPFRAMVRGTLRRPDPWQLAAAVFISLGQIAQFAALTYTSVARVAFLNSVEVYISALLAVFVFRTEPLPSLHVLAATGLATAGVILVAAG